MSTTDPNGLVRLRNGTEAPGRAVTATFIALRRLAESGDITDLMALYELREIARNPAHQPWPGTPERLKAIGLLGPDGGMHGITRDVVLSAVAGDADVHLIGPISGAFPVTSEEK